MSLYFRLLRVMKIRLGLLRGLIAEVLQEGPLDTELATLKSMFENSGLVIEELEQHLFTIKDDHSGQIVDKIIDALKEAGYDESGAERVLVKDVYIATISAPAGVDPTVEITMSHQP